MQISKSTARKLAIRSQGIGSGWKLPAGKEGVAQVIERIGYVQIDTISVVQRAHHHTLWSRRPDYTPQMLHELQANDRRVFEYWAHAASYVPMCDYRYYLPKMRAAADRPRDRQWLEQNAQVREDVVERIRKEGPLGSADFPAPAGYKRSSWWDWKPAKRVMEILFSMGEMMVTERRNFHRIYDLTERVLPEGTDTTMPDEDEMARFIIRRALGGFGFSSVDGIWWGPRAPDGFYEVVEELVDSGEITPVEIRGLSDTDYYALTKNIEEATKRRRKRVHILSPFDNLVIHRGRLSNLFGFNFKMECYLPAAKRRYGYFCLPILWGDQFVGRLDPKADRKKKTFIIRKIIFEPGFKDYDNLIPALTEKIRSFADFNGCERVVIEQAVPEKLKDVLMKAL